jgi:hypothetical protein
MFDCANMLSSDLPPYAEVTAKGVPFQRTTGQTSSYFRRACTSDFWRRNSEELPKTAALF